MVRELLGELYSLYREYTGTGSIIVLFILSAIVLEKSDKDRHKKPVYLSVLGTVGCAVSEIITRLSGVSAVFAAAICILAVAVSGSNVLSAGMNSRAENVMHLPANLVESMDVILNESDTPGILTMPDWNLYFESYSSDFTVVTESNLNAELSKTHPDMKKVAQAAHECNCEYVVISSDIWPEVPITEFGYELMYETDGCVVYKEVKTP